MPTRNDRAYLNKWKARDAAERANGMPPSKLGPGVPAVTTTDAFGGVTAWDDNGIEIPGGDPRGRGRGRD